ncbi:B12-binding domain-containing radical SAM protein [Magnetofaba australis]|uniref:Putative radical SAM protein n=1 Tax=Magnetofaba australis IT-1 TaxID=1434232 RepID=A0A1Y2K1Q3_9PROT|nr:radical SAM protein [Magnetofaba australis]OSM01938.1 putative radical SAM protein [Magnetofaba australis IT-1]
MNGLYLVTANSKKKLYAGTANTLAAIAPNIPLGILEAYMSAQGVPTVMIDAEAEGLSNAELANRLQQAQPDLVCVLATGANPSASTMTMVGVIDLFEQMRRVGVAAGAACVWGGHPTVLPERTLRETGADFVILGEGFDALSQLYAWRTQGGDKRQIPGLAYFENARFVQQAPPPLAALDDLPRINWDKMNPARYRAHNWHCFGEEIDQRSPYAIIWTNQGCPYPCDFCSVNNVFGQRKFRFRSMENVVAEIDDLVQNHGVRRLKILDELFAIKHPRIDQFCDLLEERGYDLDMWCFARIDSVTPQMLKRLKRVGVNWIAYGFESFDESIVASTNKRVSAQAQETIDMTREAGIHICADVIVGLWEDSVQSVRRTRDFLFKNQFEWVNVYPAFAYPGTPMYDAYLRDGVISTPTSWDAYGLYSDACEPAPTKHLSPAQVLALRDELFNDYFRSPEILRMLENTFGVKTRRHVEQMMQISLPRKLLQDDA